MVFCAHLCWCNFRSQVLYGISKSSSSGSLCLVWLHRLSSSIESLPVLSKFINATQFAKSIPKLTTAGTSFLRRRSLLVQAFLVRAVNYPLYSSYTHCQPYVYPVYNALCTLTYQIFIIAGLCIAIDLVLVGQQHNLVIVQKGDQVVGTWNDNNTQSAAVTVSRCG